MFLNDVSIHIHINAQVCTDAITFLNQTYNDTMNLEYSKPKIVKGFVGALLENIDLPDEFRLVKSKLFSALCDGCIDSQIGSIFVSCFIII